jgi:hypothetical protein
VGVGKPRPPTLARADVQVAAFHETGTDQLHVRIAPDGLLLRPDPNERAVAGIVGVELPVDLVDLAVVYTERVECFGDDARVRTQGIGRNLRASHEPRAKITDTRRSWVRRCMELVYTQ